MQIKLSRWIFQICPYVFVYISHRNTINKVKGGWRIQMSFIVFLNNSLSFYKTCQSPRKKVKAKLKDKVNQSVIKYGNFTHQKNILTTSCFLWMKTPKLQILKWNAYNRLINLFSFFSKCLMFLSYFQFERIWQSMKIFKQILESWKIFFS